MKSRRKTIEHYNITGHAHFLTFSCYSRLPLLNQNRTRYWFTRATVEAKEKYEFAIWAYVIMPEHAHLIMYPLLQSYDISLLLKAIKQSVSRKAKHYLQKNSTFWLNKLTVKRGQRTVFRFWQSGPGYDLNVYNEKELLEKINYIHNNPVKRGLALSPEEWDWSSASWYEGERNVKLAIDDYTDYSNKQYN